MTMALLPLLLPLLSFPCDVFLYINIIILIYPLFLKANLSHWRLCDFCRLFYIFISSFLCGVNLMRTFAFTIHIRNLVYWNFIHSQRKFDGMFCALFIFIRKVEHRQKEHQHCFLLPCSEINPIFERISSFTVKTLSKTFIIAPESVFRTVRNEKDDLKNCFRRWRIHFARFFGFVRAPFETSYEGRELRVREFGGRGGGLYGWNWNEAKSNWDAADPNRDWK